MSLVIRCAARMPETRNQKRKCENALLASAMRCTSSRFLRHCPCSATHRDLTGQALTHRFLAPVTGVIHQPAHGQRNTASRANFDRHLIGSTTHTADFTSTIGAMFSSASSNTSIGSLVRSSTRSNAPVNDRFGDRLLAADHDVVHELGEGSVPELGIGQYFTFCNNASSWHD
jgi:hypothetical protein